MRRVTGVVLTTADGVATFHGQRHTLPHPAGSGEARPFAMARVTLTGGDSFTVAAAELPAALAGSLWEGETAAQLADRLAAEVAAAVPPAVKRQAFERWRREAQTGLERLRRVIAEYRPDLADAEAVELTERLRRMRP